MILKLRDLALRMERLFVQNFHFALKYVSISVGMYLAILSSMYLLVDIMGIQKTPAYVATYLVSYILDYLLNLYLLFHRDHNWTRVAKYVLQIAFFLACGAAIFKILIFLDINYLIATLMTAIVLMPLRYFAYKIVVFR